MKLDPAGDSNGQVSNPAYGDPKTLDVLSLEVNWTQDGALRFTVELAADPRAHQDFVNYYWVSVEGATASGGNPSTWTMQRNATYDWIETMYWEDRTSGFPVTWQGSTFTFSVPRSAFVHQFGESWNASALYSPRVSTAGPYKSVDLVVTSTSLSPVVASGDDASYYPDEVSIPVCPVEASDEASRLVPTVGPTSASGTRLDAVTSAPGDGTKSSPPANLVGVGLLLGALALARRR